MQVKAKVNKAYLNQIKQKAQNNLAKTADAIRTDLIQSQTMPMDTGTLQNNSTFVDTSKKAQNKVSIISDTPYARRLYFHPEYRFRQDKNPNAGGMWFEPYLRGSKKNYANKIFAQFMERDIK